MSSSEAVALNGSEVWGFVVEVADGMRLRVPLDDWERLGLYRGQRIPVRRSGRDEEWLFVSEVVELPPLVWLVMGSRVRVAG
jgi:hypothetical protein